MMAFNRHLASSIGRAFEPLDVSVARRGTECSNPPSSSAESVANLVCGVSAGGYGRQVRSKPVTQFRLHSLAGRVQSLLHACPRRPCCVTLTG
jgi:hypothetical protein